MLNTKPRIVVNVVSYILVAPNFLKEHHLSNLLSSFKLFALPDRLDNRSHILRNITLNDFGDSHRFKSFAMYSLIFRLRQPNYRRAIVQAFCCVIEIAVAYEYIGLAQDLPSVGLVDTKHLRMLLFD